MTRDIERFYQAIVDGKSEYELHELRLKALHTDGLLLEEVHKYEDSMNYVLQRRTEMEKLNLTILGNRSFFQA
jgi:ABC-type siderophore export system fused ATPase/permease subunit